MFDQRHHAALDTCVQVGLTIDVPLDYKQRLDALECETNRTSHGDASELQVQDNASMK